MRTLFLVLAILIPPFLAFASDSLTLQQRVALRMQQRLQSSQQVRIGRQVLPRTTSPRRTAVNRTVEFVDVFNAAIIHVRQPDGTLQEVRLLGIDAPEILPPPRGPECYAVEAREHLRQYLRSATDLQLQKESGYHYDSEDRLVRYVHANGRDVGAWLLSNGYAFRDPDHEHRKDSVYAEEQEQAQDEEIGLWSGRCNYQETDDYRLNP